MHYLIKGEVGGIAFWRILASALKEGSWKGKALKLHKKAMMYILPCEAFAKIPKPWFGSASISILKVNSYEIVNWQAEDLEVSKKTIMQALGFTSWELTVKIGDKSFTVKPKF